MSGEGDCSMHRGHKMALVGGACGAEGGMMSTKERFDREICLMVQLKRAKEEVALQDRLWKHLIANGLEYDRSTGEVYIECQCCGCRQASINAEAVLRGRPLDEIGILQYGEERFSPRSGRLKGQPPADEPTVLVLEFERTNNYDDPPMMRVRTCARDWKDWPLWTLLSDLERGALTIRRVPECEAAGLDYYTPSTILYPEG